MFRASKDLNEALIVTSLRPPELLKSLSKEIVTVRPPFCLFYLRCGAGEVGSGSLNGCGCGCGPSQPRRRRREVECWILPGFSPPRCLRWAQMGWRETSKATRRQNLREKGPLLVHCCHGLIRVHTASILSVLPPPVSVWAQNPNSSQGLYAESAGTPGRATVTTGHV